MLVATILLSPLPFGSRFQWSWGALAVLVGLILLSSLLAGELKRNALPPGAKALWVPASLYALVAIWVAVQASGLTPQSWHPPVWQQAQEVLGVPIDGSVSLNPFETWSEFAKLLIYAAIFWLAFVYGESRDRLRAGLWVFACGGALYAVYGIVAQLTGLSTNLWWQEISRGHPNVTSTFINRNMYADYAGFGCLAVACLLLDKWASINSPSDGGSWLRMAKGRDSIFLLLVLMAIVLLAALTMTGSRGGVVATALALGALGMSITQSASRKLSSKRKIAGIALAFFGLWAAIFVFSGSYLGTRLAESGVSELTMRLSGYKIILSAIAEAPLTGFGAGSARDVFYLYNDGSLWITFNYAHNTLLGPAVELGLPAALALITAIVWIAAVCFRGIGQRRKPMFPALGVAATILVAVHGLVDSPLRPPANAATYSFLLGLAYAQAWPLRSARTGP